jgi:hypothetical protein
MVVVDNDYPSVPEGGDTSKEMTVYKVWWVTSLLPDAVSPGSEGQAERTVPNTDFAYAVLAPGWDPASTTPPTQLIAAKSSAKLTIARGDTLHVHVSDETFEGNCTAGKPLSQDDADFITQRIFPVSFANVQYDAKTCTATPTTADGGVDGGLDASDAEASDGGTEAGAVDAGPG